MKGKRMAKCAASKDMIALADMLKILSDVNRLRIICLLSSGEKCVCEIEEGLGISQPLASHHLGILREAGLVEVRKEATSSYYSLVSEGMQNLNDDFMKILGTNKVLESSQARIENDTLC
jgi:ArsR family transcriptional regulator